jgi:adenine phosphoribosyltransferase
MSDLKKYIREVSDFPKPGITFYDITTLILDPDGFSLALDRMEDFVKGKDPDLLIGVESRGFIFGAALADRLGLGLALARKAGKLPSEIVFAEYALEYGTDRVELHQDAVKPGTRVVVVDDLLATGGTMKAVCDMVEQLGAEIAGVSIVVELNFLPWHDKLSRYDVDYLVSYHAE